MFGYTPCLLGAHTVFPSVFVISASNLRAGPYSVCVCVCVISFTLTPRQRGPYSTRVAVTYHLAPQMVDVLQLPKIGY
jgi:hypothetical protein